MGLRSLKDESFADRAIEQLRHWPSLTVCRADSGNGRGVALSTRQIVHLHGGGEAEIYLTRPVVQRMAEVLLGSGRVAMSPDDDWVRVRLDSDGDVRLFTSLVSVAIKASAQSPHEPHRPIASCPDVV